MRGLRMLLASAVLAFSAACTTGTSEDSGLSTTFSAQMASSWHWVGDPQRIQIGIFGSDANGIRAVTHGSIDLTFSFLGADGGGDPRPGPTATATYVAVPGTSTSGDGPALSAGDLGVYEAEDVTFDAAGLWHATIAAEIDGVARELATDFVVTDASPIPAPGDPAPRTENLTLDSRGASDASVDSMAGGGGGIPDPELHRWTIADAVEQGRPALVLFGTPAHCTSRFCGPEVEELQRLAAAYPDRAVYIHVEIWKDFEGQVVNRAAADWLLRELPDGTPEMTEPWLYLIDAHGIVADRWGSLFDATEVAAALEALPPMAA
jgi:hypothetical protein